jgi:hypothetical protein
MQSISVLMLQEKTGIDIETRDKYRKRKSIFLTVIRIIIIFEFIVYFVTMPIECIYDGSVISYKLQGAMFVTIYAGAGCLITVISYKEFQFID